MPAEFYHEIKEYFKKFLDEETKKRIHIIAQKETNEFGVDQFGFDANTLFSIAPFMVWLYRHYFRCEVFGIENIPSKRVMVVANHSGQLPFDAAMIITAFILEPKEPQFLRGMVEKWSSEIPFIGTLFSRLGQVVGSPSLCKKILEKENSVIVFPEGVRGIAKLFSERYQLCRFGSGFIRVALSAKTPILPVALIGAEEQAPCVANITLLAKALGMPAFPLIFPQLIPLPLPTKYRIYIGKPIYFLGDGSEDDDKINIMVQETKDNLQAMINKGLADRSHIFF